jgi:hypothetical protein
VRKIYATGDARDGKRFSHDKLWKGHRPVPEEHVEHQRMVAARSPSESERATAAAWLAEYEAMGCESS